MLDPFGYSKSAFLRISPFGRLEMTFGLCSQQTSELLLLKDSDSFKKLKSDLAESSMDDRTVILLFSHALNRVKGCALSCAVRAFKWSLKKKKQIPACKKLNLS